MKSRLGMMLALLCVTGKAVMAQVSPMGLNAVALQELQDQPHYNFWVGGHVCGDGSKYNQSIYPASSFIANTQMFDASAARFVMLLGDSFNRITPMHADAMRRSLGQLSMPVINVMGKNEQAQRQEYETLFNQPANSQFMIGPDVCLMVDSFAENWDWLIDRLETISQTPAMRHVFIFTSRMPWGADELLPTLPTRRQVAEPVMLPSAEKFNEQVKPLLTRLAQIKNVYWFAGNIHSRHIHNSFYWKDDNSSLTVVATAMTGDADDTMLNVQVDALGIVRIFPVSLAGGMISDIHQYSLANWQTDTAQWRLDHPTPGLLHVFTHKSKEVITSKKFAAGIFGGIVMGVIVMLISRPAAGRRVRRPVNIEQVALPTPQPHDLFARLDDDQPEEDESRQAA